MADNAPGHPSDTLPAGTSSDGESAASLLELRNVQVNFSTGRGLVRAVDGVDLDVRHGEVLALVGESGCGKTTLIRSILGLERATAGTFVFDGSPVSPRARSLRTLRRRVQMIFQDPTGALNPRHTIYEAVAEGIRIHKVAGDEPTLVADALARAGLRPPARYLQRYPHEVSGGQRQRVLIAGAMALGPQLLLADEPVASLDASIRGEILALMRSLVDEHGISIIAVTHDLGLAWNIADRVAVMYLGRIVEIGATEQVLSDPQHPYTRALLSVVPEKERMEQQILTGETPDPSRIPSGCRFHPRCPLVASGQAARLGIEQACRGIDVDLVELDPGHLVACHAALIPFCLLQRSDGPMKQTVRGRGSEGAGEGFVPGAGGEHVAVAEGMRWRSTRIVSASDWTSMVPTVEHVASGQLIVNEVRPRAHARPGSTVDTPSSPSYTSSITDAVEALVVARRTHVRTVVSRPSTSCETCHTTPSASSADGPSPGSEHVSLRFGEPVDDRTRTRSTNGPPPTSAARAVASSSASRSRRWRGATCGRASTLLEPATRCASPSPGAIGPTAGRRPVLSRSAWSGRPSCRASRSSTGSPSRRTCSPPAKDLPSTRPTAWCGTSRTTSSVARHRSELDTAVTTTACTAP